MSEPDAFCMRPLPWVLRLLPDPALTVAFLEVPRAGEPAVVVTLPASMRDLLRVLHAAWREDEELALPEQIGWRSRELIAKKLAQLADNEFPSSAGAVRKTVERLRQRIAMALAGKEEVQGDVSAVPSPVQSRPGLGLRLGCRLLVVTGQEQGALAGPE